MFKNEDETECLLQRLLTLGIADLSKTISLQLIDRSISIVISREKKRLFVRPKKALRNQRGLVAGKVQGEFLMSCYISIKPKGIQFNIITKMRKGRS